MIVSHLQQIVIISKLPNRAFSTRACTSYWGCRSGRNWAKLGRHKIRQKNSPQRRLHYTHRQSHILTNTTAAKTSHAHYVVRAGVGRTEHQRRHPETTREIISWSQSGQRAPTKSRVKVANSTVSLFCTPVLSTIDTSCLKKWLSLNFSWGFRGSPQVLLIVPE